MITEDEYKKALNIVTEYRIQVKAKLLKTTKDRGFILKFSNVNSETKVYDSGCSIKLLNIIRENPDILRIKYNGYDDFWDIKISELSRISIRDFLHCRRAGKVALEELKALCFCAGVCLKP